MNPIPYVFLALAFVGLVANIVMFVYFGSHGGMGRPWVLIVRCILLALVVFCVVIAWQCRSTSVFRTRHGLVKKLMGWISKSDRFNAISLEWAYQKVQSNVLGRYVAEKMAGSRCVILREPMLKTVDGTESVNPVFDGLMEGLGGKLEVVKIIDLPMKKEAPPPLKPGEEEPVTLGWKDEVWTVADLDEILADVSDFDLLVTCVPLPEGVVGMDGQVMSSCLAGKKIAMAGGYSGLYDAALEKGVVVAAVTYKPECRFDEKDIPGNIQEAFDKRYVLLKGGPREEPKEELVPADE